MIAAHVRADKDQIQDLIHFLHFCSCVFESKKKGHPPLNASDADYCALTTAPCTPLQHVEKSKA